MKKGSFWWRDIELLDRYKGMARVQINNGKSCFFWEDIWYSDVLNHQYAELYSFVKKSISLLLKAGLRHLCIIFFTCPYHSRLMLNSFTSKES